MFGPVFQLEIACFPEESPSHMSIRATLNDAILAIRAIFDLEDTVARAADMLRDTLLSGHKVLVCGNGGSASDSAHFATELACRFVSDRRPYPAISLTGDGGLMTAIGNDYSFAELFARQVRAFGTSGDLLVALTTSGNSANIKRALEQAKELGLSSIALLGRDGGLCRGLADIELLIPGQQVTARIQEAHKVIIHLLCELVEPDLAKK
jgi:phosphoheptose isomerase